jgi:hypothetical protein
MPLSRCLRTRGSWHHFYYHLHTPNNRVAAPALHWGVVQVLRCFYLLLEGTHQETPC